MPNMAPLSASAADMAPNSGGVRLRTYDGLAAAYATYDDLAAAFATYDYARAVVTGTPEMRPA